MFIIMLYGLNFVLLFIFYFYCFLFSFVIQSVLDNYDILKMDVSRMPAAQEVIKADSSYRALVNQEPEEIGSSWNQWSVKKIASKVGEGVLITAASVVWFSLFVAFVPAIVAVGISLGAVCVVSVVVGIKIQCLDNLLSFFNSKIQAKTRVI